MIKTGDKRLDKYIASSGNVSQGILVSGFLTALSFLFVPLLLPGFHPLVVISVSAIAVYEMFAKLGRRLLGLLLPLSIPLFWFLIYVYHDMLFESPESPMPYWGFAIALAPVYLGYWLYARLILKHLQETAHRQIQAIQEKPSIGFDEMCEEAVLWSLVLCDFDQSIRALQPALQTRGGNSVLLYWAGTIMLRAKRYTDSVHFFDRALDVTTNKNETDKIKKDRILAQVLAHSTGKTRKHFSEQCPYCAGTQVDKAKARDFPSVGGGRRCGTCGMVWLLPLSRLAAAVCAIVSIPFFFGLVINANNQDELLAIDFIVGLCFVLISGYVGYFSLLVLFGEKRILDIRELPAETTNSESLGGKD